MHGYDFTTHDEKILFNTVFMTAGENVPTHLHDYSHDCFVVSGTVRFEIGSISKDLEAPSTVHFPHGAMHSWVALTDAIVICTHPVEKVSR